MNEMAEEYIVSNFNIAAVMCGNIYVELVNTKQNYSSLHVNNYVKQQVM